MAHTGVGTPHRGIDRGLTRQEAAASRALLVQDCIAAQRRLERFRAAQEMVKAMRGAAIRSAVAGGVEGVSLAREMGLSRSQLYEALREPGESDSQWFERIEHAEEEARRRWAASGARGDLDDFWPLDF